MRFCWKSKVAIFAGILALGLVVFVSLSHKVYAQSSTNLVLYDNFDERFLDPSKWYGLTAANDRTLEFVREIQDDRLRLAVRTYGATNSNQGNQFGQSELHFTNPASVRSIATEFAIRRASALGCPTNPGMPSGGGASIIGRFFNSGSGNVGDDVDVNLIFGHSSDIPPGVAWVVVFMHWQGQYFYVGPGGTISGQFVSFGSINVGQKVIAQLSWDQPRHQFVASFTDVVTGKVTQVLLPYTMPDTTPPASTDKVLAVRTSATNCVGTQTFADMEATFDKVWIGN
jgi:hypothetical protein